MRPHATQHGTVDGADAAVDATQDLFLARARDATTREHARQRVEAAYEAHAAVDGGDQASVAARILEIVFHLEELVVDADSHRDATEGLEAHATL